MCEIIIKDDKLFNIFNEYYDEDNERYYIVPKDNHIHDVLINNSFIFTDIYSYNKDKTNNMWKQCVMLKYPLDSYEINLNNSWLIDEDDIFIIHFKNEEDAFYFKLKYC